MKIGARLTLWGTVITLTACAAVCVTLYIGLSVSLHDEVDSFLGGEVQEFLAILRDEDDESFTEIEADIRRELGSRERNDLTFRLLDTQGRLLLSSHAQENLPEPWPLGETSRSEGDPWFETIHTGSPDTSTRACSMSANLPDRGKFIVQATYSLDGVNAALARFRHSSMVVLVVAAFGSLIGGRIMARKSLRPVYEMTRTASTITANDLSLRLARSGDNDELDQLASVLNDMLDRLERQIERIRQFTADAAHELRTPLAALRGSAEVALDENASAETRRETLEESIEEYDRLSRLTDDLLLLARADAGHLLTKREPVDLGCAIHDVVELFGVLAEENQLDLRVAPLPSVEIEADPERIRQVLCNLIDNAIKFTPANGRIDINLTSTQQHTTITITDTGHGIAHDHLPHLFDRFYRADAARSRTGGFGLGLPICRTIVEALDGVITINSTSNQGTTVQIQFPHQV